MRPGVGASIKIPKPAPEKEPPPEQAVHIALEYLEAPGDRGAASFVCRSWHRAEATTRSSVAVRSVFVAAPARAARRFPNAQHIQLKGRPRFGDSNLLSPGWAAWAAALAAGDFPAIRSLSLKRITVTDDDLDLLARSLPPSFRELSLVHCDGFSSRGLASLASRRLRVLDVVDCELDKEEDGKVRDWVAAFPGGGTDLESLSFECFAPQVPFASLEALVARSPRLRRLKVNNHVSLGELRRLMVLTPRLTHLGTGSFRRGKDEGLDVERMRTAFASAGRANSLVSLSGFSDCEPEHLPAIGPIAAKVTSMDLRYAAVNPDQVKNSIGECRSLQTLWLPESVRDEGLEAVAMYCNNLHALGVLLLDDTTLVAEELVSDVGLTAISEGCRRLRSIVYFCRRMTNAAVISVSERCKDLESFRLLIAARHRRDRVTGEPMDEGIGAIVRNCRKLTRLSASADMTDRAFEDIGKYGSSLRTLSVGFAGDSDTALERVLQGCSKLEKLEAVSCPFGHAGLLSGMHRFYHHMKSVWMSGCSRLTLEGCKEVARQLPQQLVLEPINTHPENEKTDVVDTLYIYPSVEARQQDAGGADMVAPFL